MKFTHTFRVPRIDVDAYRKALDRKMSEAIAQAVTVWLDAVLMEIPVWSGASQATFVKLAQEIQYGLPARIAVFQSLTAPRPDRTGQGEAQSTGKLECANGRYVFTYGTTLPWLIWNEYHNANVDRDPSLFYRVIKEGPYNFQAKGAEAFKRFAETVELPRVASFVKSYPVK